MTMRKISDEMLLAAIAAMEPDRIQGFTYGTLTENPVHVIRDVYKAPDRQEVFRRSAKEMTDAEWTTRCKMERFRIGLQAAFAVVDGESTSKRKG